MSVNGNKNISPRLANSTLSDWNLLRVPWTQVKIAL